MKKDRSGERFGRLVAVSQERNKDGRLWWLCRCDCGKTVLVRSYCLTRGDTTSCGCFRKERQRESSKTHGMSGTRTHNIWMGITKRCKNKNSTRYEFYGERGIGVCDRWSSFESFVEDMGVAKPGESIERIDNEKGYSKENCKWSTKKEQMRNTRKNIFFEVDGVSKTLAEWSELSGIDYNCLYYRIVVKRLSAKEAISKESGYFSRSRRIV